MSDDAFTAPASETALATIINRSLAGMLNGGFSDALQEAFRPLLEEAFRRGMRVGIERAKNAADTAIDLLMTIERPDGEQQTLGFQVKVRPTATPRESGKRAPPGAVRPIVELALQDRPGARMIEIQNISKMLDAGISPSSISNELNRHLGTRYRRDDGRWFLIGDPGQVPGLALERVPGASVGEAESGTPDPAPPASRAA